MKNKVRGFTLTELLITIAILGVLAKIAYPSYVENVKQGKRKEAQAALVSFSNAMEMWKMQNNNSYLGATVGTSGIFSSTVPVSGGTATYNLSIDTASPLTATTYTLKAVPVSTDAKCGTLTLDNTGITTPTTEGCW